MPFLVSIGWPSFVTQWVVAKKIYSKMHPVSCTNIYHDVTDLVNHEMVKNTKSWISWERNITFLQNKKILNLCIILHSLRSYHFCSRSNLLNMPDFWIWQNFEYGRVLCMQALNSILNMPEYDLTEFWVYHGF